MIVFNHSNHNEPSLSQQNYCASEASEHFHYVLSTLGMTWIDLSIAIFSIGCYYQISLSLTKESQPLQILKVKFSSSNNKVKVRERLLEILVT
jgi:hypothetical protein